MCTSNNDIYQINNSKFEFSKDQSISDIISNQVINELPSKSSEDNKSSIFELENLKNMYENILNKPQKTKKSKIDPKFFCSKIIKGKKDYGNDSLKYIVNKFNKNKEFIELNTNQLTNEKSNVVIFFFFTIFFHFYSKIIIIYLMFFNRKLHPKIKAKALNMK